MISHLFSASDDNNASKKIQGNMFEYPLSPPSRALCLFLSLSIFLVLALVRYTAISHKECGATTMSEISAAGGTVPDIPAAGRLAGCLGVTAVLCDLRRFCFLHEELCRKKSCSACLCHVGNWATHHASCGSNKQPCLVPQETFQKHPRLFPRCTMIDAYACLCA